MKVIWVLRALLYKPFFGEFKMPSYIGPPIFLKGIKNIFIGKNVRIFPHIRLETHGNGVIRIMDDCAIAQNVHITSASELTIGERTTILANSFITNIDHDYTELDTHILKQKMIIKETRIGSNCFIGFGACIQAGTTLGKHCVVAAHSVVRGQYEDYTVLAGIPAKPVKVYNFEEKKWQKI